MEVGAGRGGLLLLRTWVGMGRLHGGPASRPALPERSSGQVHGPERRCRAVARNGHCRRALRAPPCPKKFSGLGALLNNRARSAARPPAPTQIGLEKAFDTPAPKEQLQLVDLLASLAARGVLSADHLRDGTAPLLEMLEDIRWGGGGGAAFFKFGGVGGGRCGWGGQVGVYI